MFVSKTLLSEAGLKPSFLSLIILHMDIRDIWSGSLELLVFSELLFTGRPEVIGFPGSMPAINMQHI